MNLYQKDNQQINELRYVRYVDDFVLLADNPAQLRLWHRQIAEFLQTRLRLKLKDEHRVAPLQAGVDFLGYVVYPHHRLVRRRVVVRHGALLALSALAGGVLLLAADVAARTVVAPRELPVGLLTAVFGGAYLLALLRRRR